MAGQIMITRMRFFVSGFLALAFLCGFFSGCETLPSDAPEIAAMNAAILSEPQGNYFVGRRQYKDVYKMWGWVREPGKPWKTARLVMFNEQKKLAPDREAGKLGSDNNYEYRLFGYYSGESIYEPASNRIYPEFVLTGYELINKHPARIYTMARQIDPTARILIPPM